jgi:hypothetical protein
MRDTRFWISLQIIGFTEILKARNPNVIGHSQNHLSVAGGYVVDAFGAKKLRTYRYREVVLPVPKYTLE